MSIRAVFFDVDGTLLGAGHRIPPSALEALHAARQNGVRLFIATGRVTAMALFLKDMFDFDGYLTLTGQYGFDRSGRVLHRLPHDPEDIRILIAAAGKGAFPLPDRRGGKLLYGGDSDLVRMHFTDHGLPEPALYDIRRSKHTTSTSSSPTTRSAPTRSSRRCGTSASRTPPATATT